MDEGWFVYIACTVLTRALEKSQPVIQICSPRVKEIQYGGDWRKMKALRQKKLSRQEGATVSKRHKKTTKALWRQALVTRSAEAESHSDSQLARTTYDSPAGTANTE